MAQHQDENKLYMYPKPTPAMITDYGYVRGIYREYFITYKGLTLEKFNNFDEMKARLDELREAE